MRVATLVIPELRPLDRLKGLLMDWADWTRGYSGARLGFDMKSAGVASAGRDDFESLLRKTENQISKIIDVTVDDLDPIHRCAIHHRYLSAVYRFRDYAKILDEAHDHLLIVLPKKNVVI